MGRLISQIFQEDGINRYAIQILATKGPEADIPSSMVQKGKQTNIRLYPSKSAHIKKEIGKRSIAYSALGKNEAIGTTFIGFFL